MVINEIESNPSGNDNYLTVEEWVELYNPSKSSVDIGGWTLSTTHGTTVTVTIPQGVTIGDKGYYVCKRGSQWLDNDDESVVLRDSEDTEVDRSLQISDGENDYQSWQRYPNGLDTDLNSDWRFHSSTKRSSNGGTGTIGDLSTLWKNAFLVTGTSEPYGPLPWGALVDDTVGANDFTTALNSYGNPSSTSDVDVAEWVGQGFSWKFGSPTTLIVIGGTAVNLVSYQYNSLIHFDLNVTDEYIELKIDRNGIDYIRLYFNPRQYVIHYSNDAESQYDFEENDFAEVYALFDPFNNKHLFFVMGMRAEGTLGACRYLANNLDSFPSQKANAEGIILQWYDSDGDGVATGDEMTELATYP
ncbi:MAG: lamin tail domain-containing protein [Candidatus Bathyarchaeota archaeon]|nr:lamin tail domain-containing protein [Candidatus Bathyarchaeota archaeon]